MSERALGKHRVSDDLGQTKKLDSLLRRSNPGGYDGILFLGRLDLLLGFRWWADIFSASCRAPNEQGGPSLQICCTILTPSAPCYKLCHWCYRVSVLNGNPVLSDCRI